MSGTTFWLVRITSFTLLSFDPQGKSATLPKAVLKEILFEAPLATLFTLVSCLAYSLTLKMEATFSPETSLDFQRTTRRYIREDRTLENNPVLPGIEPRFNGLIIKQ
jgi:hypothetical protein